MERGTVRPATPRPFPVPGPQPARLPGRVPRFGGGKVGFGLLIGFLLWEWLNSRPPRIIDPSPSNRDLVLPGPNNRFVSVNWRGRVVTSGTQLCSNGAFVSQPENNLSSLQGASFQGIGVRVETARTQRVSTCGTPGGAFAPDQVALRQLTASGPGPVIAMIIGGGNRTESIARGTRTDTIEQLRVFDANSQLFNEINVPGELLPQVAPRIPRPAPDVLPDAQPEPPAPRRRPALPAAPPDVAPAPRPQPAPSPSPGRGPTPAPVRRAVPTPVTPAPIVPVLPQAPPVPARGPVETPETPSPQQTPRDAVIIGERIVGGPAQAPPATLQGMAQELGRLEAKLELSLNIQGQTGGAAEELQPLLEEIASKVGEIRSELLADDPGGQYQLAPACPPPAGGDPEPPVIVPVASAPSRLAGLAQRINALAGLMQVHKNMGQPSCRTPVNRSNVTVNFESD